MIRKDPRFSIHKGWLGVEVRGPEPHKRERRWTAGLPYPQKPEGGPYRLGQYPKDQSRVWIYRSAVYTTKEDLDPAAVEALILEAENRVKVRVSRAKALMAQGQMLDEATAAKRPPIPDDVKQFVWQRDGGKCVKCGSTRFLEYDHDIPFSLGGSNTARNIRLLCETCNRSKGASLL